MSNINITDLTFAYDGSYENVFENISLQISTDWKLGLIGRNGRGKTTLLKLMCGKYPYSGKISADVSFVYFPQSPDDPNELVFDIMQSAAPNAENWQIVKELSLLDVGADVIYRPYSTLSGGERTKVLLASLFLNENGFPLIDEPTNHLDLASREKVASYLKSKRGYILVSHDRALLDATIDHVISVNRNGIDVQKGNYTTWQENKDRQDSFERAENKKLKKDINRLTAAAQRNSDWSDKVESTKNGTRIAGLKVDKGYVGHMAAKMMKRSKVIENRTQTLIDEKSALFKNIDSNSPLAIRPLTFHSSRLFEMKDISISYDGATVISGFSLDMLQGERISLRGKNGCGKTSILKLICGIGAPSRGEIIKSPQLKISYLPQTSDGLNGSLSALARGREIDESLFFAVLHKLGFNKSNFDSNIECYSAGQKKKVLLAASLCERAHLYVWDEPLNYIDIMSRLQIEVLILNHKPSIIFVEHDKAFCGAVATREVIL